MVPKIGHIFGYICYMMITSQEGGVDKPLNLTSFTQKSIANNRHRS